MRFSRLWFPGLALLMALGIALAAGRSTRVPFR